MQRALRWYETRPQEHHIVHVLLRLERLHLYVPLVNWLLIDDILCLFVISSGTGRSGFLTQLSNRLVVSPVEELLQQSHVLCSLDAGLIWMQLGHLCDKLRFLRVEGLIAKPSTERRQFHLLLLGHCPLEATFLLH